MSSIENTSQYYSARASEYERTAGYCAPRHAAWAAPIKARYQLEFRDRDVLEIACGPGYWSEAMAPMVHSIVATDADAKLVSMVKDRLASFPNASCQVADAYTLEGLPDHFTGAFAQFWWSHIPKARLRSFVARLDTKLRPGASVMFMDDLAYRTFEGRRQDEAGDLIEVRKLLDGTRYEILKNFPTHEEISQALNGLAERIEYKPFRAFGYWILSYSKPA